MSFTPADLSFTPADLSFTPADLSFTQLGEHCTGIAEVVGSNPAQSLNFFQVSVLVVFNGRTCINYRYHSIATMVQITFISILYYQCETLTPYITPASSLSSFAFPVSLAMRLPTLQSSAKLSPDRQSSAINDMKVS